MPHIEISDELQVRLSEAARERGCTVAALVEELWGSSEVRFRSEPLAAFTFSSEYRAKHSDADRYLALLAWIARNNGTDFSDFIEHQESGRKYVGLSAEEIRQTCRHNQARPIPGTHFWAIMNLDTPTKRRFLRRLLVFVGERDEVINHVCSTIGGRVGTGMV